MTGGGCKCGGGICSGGGNFFFFPTLTTQVVKTVSLEKSFHDRMNGKTLEGDANASKNSRKEENSALIAKGRK